MRDRGLRYNPEKILLAVDLAGTLVFALEGAAAGIQNELDLFGLMVLAFATALGGGIIRDLLIGAIPPNSIRDWRYGAVAFAAAALLFFLYRVFQEIPGPFVMVLDAAGLSLFAMAGAAKALNYGIHPFLAVLMGTITGVGGGTIRDIFLAHVPAVLRTDIYAVAAMAGSAVMIAGIRCGLRPSAMMAAGGVVCFSLRVISVWQHWNLPKIFGS